MSSDASMESISDWYLVTAPRRRSTNSSKGKTRQIKKKRSEVREGCVRIPVYVSPRRGADKMLGSFECDLRITALVKDLRHKIAKKIGCSSSDIAMDGFGGQPFDPSLDNIVTLQELPAVIIRRIVAYQIQAAESSKEEEKAAPKHPPPPKLLTCPLTKKLFRDPWITIHGNTYERDALMQLIRARLPDPIEEESTPRTMLFWKKPRALRKSQIFPNLSVEQAVSEWMKRTRPKRSSLSKSQLALLGTTLFRRVSRNANDPPEYLLDPISFEPFHNAVCTKYGHTFSRAIIEEIIETQGEDPLNRKPLEKKDLIPNRIINTLLAQFYVSMNNQRDDEDDGSETSESDS